MTDEIDPTLHTDAAVSRASWVIGVAAALVFGMAVGAAMSDATAPGCEQRAAVHTTDR